LKNASGISSTKNNYRTFLNLKFWSQFLVSSVKDSGNAAKENSGIRNMENDEKVGCASGRKKAV